MTKKTNSFLRRILYFLLIIFILMNVMAALHAYKFTHFDVSAGVKTKDPVKLSFTEKLKAVLLGVSNPRPQNITKPKVAFQTIRVKTNKEIECWLIKARNPKGTVILCHGYSAAKSSTLEKAEIFLSLGYNTMLIDFMGSGGSEGNQTTIGFYEAQEVKSAFDYLKNKGEKNIVLFGTSMGAAAIMKCQNDYNMNAEALILECPFGSMLQTVQARFKNMHLPAFPMANLLVFWGGVENNFNAFDHNPVDYALGIKCPVLLLYGQRDDKVSPAETNAIYRNLSNIKDLKMFPLAGHEDYLSLYRKAWTTDVSSFLSALH